LTTQKVGGKRKGTAMLADGTAIDLVLHKYKQVPGLWCNLFSLTSAMKAGWQIGNEGKVITLTRNGVELKFDRILPSGDGYLCAMEIVPKTEAATVTLAAGTTVDINAFHQLMNHTAEETLRLTASAHGIKLEGELKPCFDCQIGNARKKNVAKTTAVIADSIGERIYVDISSIKATSYGGNKFWVLVVDDKTNKSWSFFVKHKDDQVEPLMGFLREMVKNGTPVKYIRLDNSGENKSWQKAVEADPHLKVKFEFTPRDSPQYNGRVERKFAFLWNGVRAVLNAAKLPQHLRTGLWAEAARYVELVSNQLVTPKRKDLGCSYRQFHGKDWEPFQYLQPFGTMAIITKTEKIKGKNDDKGIPMIYCGPAMDHANDVHRFLNPTTRRLIESRDATWMDTTYGKWKGLKETVDLDTV
jgi:hypothetical protein